MYYDTVKTTLRQNFNSNKNRLNDFLAESELQSDIVPEMVFSLHKIRYKYVFLLSNMVSKLDSA